MVTVDHLRLLTMCTDTVQSSINAVLELPLVQEGQLVILGIPEWYF